MKPLNRDSQLFFCGHHVKSYVSVSNFEPPLPNSDIRVLKATKPQRHPSYRQRCKGQYAYEVP